MGLFQGCFEGKTPVAIVEAFSAPGYWLGISDTAIALFLLLTSSQNIPQGRVARPHQPGVKFNTRRMYNIGEKLYVR
jgi:hypothetical protein